MAVLSFCCLGEEEDLDWGPVLEEEFHFRGAGLVDTMKRTLDKSKQKVTKGITQAATLGHVNLLPFKFRFELSEVRVSKLKAQKGKVVCIWERRDKQVSEAVEENWMYRLMDLPFRSQ